MNLPSLSSHFNAQKAVANIVRTAHRKRLEYNVRSPGYQLVWVDCDFFHIISAGFALHETKDKVGTAPYLQGYGEVTTVKTGCKDREVHLAFCYYDALLFPYFQKNKRIPCLRYATLID